eukprot:5484627-Karenia_brevis.AAC.1
MALYKNPPPVKVPTVLKAKSGEAGAPKAVPKPKEKAAPEQLLPIDAQGREPTLLLDMVMSVERSCEGLPHSVKQAIPNVVTERVLLWFIEFGKEGVVALPQNLTEGIAADPDSFQGQAQKLRIWSKIKKSGKKLLKTFIDSLYLLSLIHISEPTRH